jgi:hypothetical protein
MKLFFYLFCNFKYCRQKLGGRWYRIKSLDGFGEFTYWNRVKPLPSDPLDTIIEEENYDN